MELIQVIRSSISLQPKQLEAYERSLITPMMLYGGARGGGKSYLVRAREVLRRAEYPGSKGLIIRKTYPELLANHIRPFFTEYPGTRELYNKSEKTIYWPNGSTTEFSYLQGQDDVYTYQGREYEDISVDEVTQHLWETIKILRASNRTVMPKITPTMFLTGNPGGVGHQDVKRLFVDKIYLEGEDPEDYDFVQAFVKDNKELMDKDPDYVKRLKALPDRLRRAYLDGDWNVFAGVAFDELDSIHIVKPFRLPDNTRFLAGYDYGYAHPFAFILLAITPDGKVYVVDYLCKNKKRPDEQAKMIVDKLDEYGIPHIYIYAGTDIWSNREGRDTIYEQLRSGVGKRGTFLRAHTDHIQKVAEIRKLVAWRNTQTGDPQLRFFENTIDVFNQVRSMQIDPKKPEDVIKINADEDGTGGDDLYDGLSYGIMARLYPSPDKKPEIKEGTGAELMEFVKMKQRIKKWGY